MSNQESTIEQFFNLIREAPDKAIEALDSNHELAKVVWKGDEDMIVGSTPLTGPPTTDI